MPPVTLEQVNALLTDVSQRIQALPVALTEEQIKGIINQVLETRLADPNDAVYRKMRFGGAPDGAPLIGSKFARHNLSLADIEFLYDLQTSLRGQRRVDGEGVYGGPSDQLENAFKAISKAAYLTDAEVRAIDKQALDNVFPRITKANQRAYEEALKAMDSAESGYGSQLIGAQYVGDLWEAARPQSRVFGLLDTFEMTAPTTYLPVEVDIPEMLYLAESTAYNSSNFTTVKTGSNRVTVTAKKFGIHQMWSGELEEDSIIPFVPFLRRQAQLSLAHYSDSVVVNGDTTDASTNINTDIADVTDTKHFLAMDGLRHACIIDNTGNLVSAAGGPPTIDALLGLRTTMIDRTYLHDWGHPTNPDDLVYLCDPETGDAACKIDELKTVDKYGSGATVLTGEVAKIGRHPLITTIAIAKSLNTGKVATESGTIGNNLYGQAVAFNRRGFKVGWRRRVKLETERIPATDQTRIVYTLRMGLGRFTPTGAAAGIESVAELYYIGL